MFRMKFEINKEGLQKVKEQIKRIKNNEMTKTEQLILMIENYEDVLEHSGVVDELIIYTSKKISEANKECVNKGWNYAEDDF